MSGKVISDVRWHVGLMTRTMPDDAGSEHHVQNHWHMSDERYVTRGRQLLARAWLKRWPAELGRVNRGKRGRPFVLPPTMLEAVRRMLVSMRLSWRALEGVLRGLLNVKAPDHTTIWKRLAAEGAAPTVPPREAIVAVDATGFSTTLRGEWLRGHWHRRRGFVKAHVMIDVETLEVLAVVVTDDRVSDSAVFASLIERALERGIVVRRVLADGAYDHREMFDLLHERGIEAGIKIKRGAMAKSKGSSFARPRAMRERDALGQAAWEERYEYSLRWMIE